uniref:KH domain-containing protein n=1 Tax=Steinernema glaseri TaxID=37863 RepID=A0A1I7ZMV3_9BILA
MEKTRRIITQEELRYDDAGTLLTSSNGSTPITSTITQINNNNPAVANNNTNTTYTIDYLTQLLKDKKQLAAFPNVFHHLERLVDDEINKVRVTLFQTDFIKEALILPEPMGDVVTVTEKVFVPAKEYPDYNFVGRILGPRGMTAKQLEQETGCKIMVRGKGSMRDKKKEEMNRGKANWEHLSEELHVLIQCEDTPNRCEVKIKRAVEQVKKLLVPAPEGEDELKRKQLMELAIINGTFRNSGSNNTAAQLAAAVASSTNKQQLLLLENAAANQRLLTPTLQSLPTGTIRSPNLAGAPIIMSPSRNGQNQAANVAAALAQIQNNSLVASAVPNPATNPSAAIEYQQLMLNSMHYDPVNGYQAVPVSAAAAALQQQQQQQYVAALMGASAAASPFLGDYAAAVAAANAAAGGGLDISQAGQLIVHH